MYKKLRQAATDSQDSFMETLQRKSVAKKNKINRNTEVWADVWFLQTLFNSQLFLQ